MTSREQLHRSEPPLMTTVENRCLPLPVVVILVHAVLAYLVWLLLFIVKWFPYGGLVEVRDWLYRYF